MMSDTRVVPTAAAGTAEPGATDPQQVLLWPLEEMKGFERTLDGDPESSSRNPVLSLTNVTERETVRRTSFGKSGEAEIHAGVTDVVCILSGEGEFLAGGEVESPRTTNPGEIRGPSISGGETKAVGVGDVIIIPPGVPHQILVKPGGRVSFLVAKYRHEDLVASQAASQTAR
jgi:mannose-6-phosphate isomerase-like protein (cupin superfamily)